MTEDSVLQTLRLVPDEIIIAVAGDELDMDVNSRCLCGWIVREKIARCMNAAPESSEVRSLVLDHSSSYEGCSSYGGEEREWSDIYYGVTRREELPIIEAAFVRRFEEAMERVS